MTSASHASGTERIAEVAATQIAPSYLNVQGDEPLVEPAALEDLIGGMEALSGRESAPAVGTLATPLRDLFDAADPRVVKVVTDFTGNALYFSRSPIPHTRDDTEATSSMPPPSKQRPVMWKHLGVYYYRRDVLLAFPKLPPGRLERLEQLEQLRLLEHGYRIHVVETPHDTVSVDHPSDVARVEAILKS